MNIGTALNVGYTIANIMSFLTGNYPKLGKKIKEAQKLGYDIEKIVKTFSDMTPEDLERFEKSKDLDGDNPWISARETQRQGSAEVKGKEYLIKGAKLAAIPLAAYGIQKYLNRASQSSQILPTLQNQLPPTQIGQITPQPPPNPSPTTPIISPNPTGGGLVPPNIAPQTVGQQVGQAVQSPVTQAMQPSDPNQIAQASQAIPSEPQQPIPIFEQLLDGIDPSTLDQPQQDQLKFLSIISDQLQSKGKTLNDPEFKNLAKKIQAVVAKKPGMILEESARFQRGLDEKKSNVKPLDIEETSIIEPSVIHNPQEIKKGESVVTEDGNIAEVKGTSGNNFLIEENGKVRQVPMDSLRSQPEAIKKAKIVFDPSKIPEEDRSAALSISLPMPDRSSIINMFHDGSFYIYRRKDGKPIDESIVRRVIDGQDIPMTTGETFMGAWNQEKGDSRGSAAYKELTSLAQDANQEDDPSKPLVFEKITDSYTHGYLKEFLKLLKESGRQFSAKPKKIKK